MCPIKKPKANQAYNHVMRFISDEVKITCLSSRHSSFIDFSPKQKFDHFSKYVCFSMPLFTAYSPPEIFAKVLMSTCDLKEKLFLIKKIEIFTFLQLFIF